MKGGLGLHLKEVFKGAVVRNPGQTEATGSQMWGLNMSVLPQIMKIEVLVCLVKVEEAWPLAKSMRNICPIFLEM